MAGSCQGAFVGTQLDPAGDVQPRQVLFYMKKQHNTLRGEEMEQHVPQQARFQAPDRRCKNSEPVGEHISLS